MKETSKECCVLDGPLEMQTLQANSRFSRVHVVKTTGPLLGLEALRASLQPCIADYPVLDLFLHLEGCMQAVVDDERS
jgi:hypothetical protein